MQLFTSLCQLRDVPDIGEDSAQFAVVVKNGNAGNERGMTMKIINDLGYGFLCLYDFQSARIRHGACFNQISDGAADDCFPAEAGNTQIGRIAIQNLPHIIGDEQSVIRGFDDIPEQLVLGKQFLWRQQRQPPQSMSVFAYWRCKNA